MTRDILTKTINTARWSRVFSVRRLLRIELRTFSGATVTLQLSDQPLRLATSGEWWPLVVEWGEAAAGGLGLTDGAMAERGSFAVTINNTIPITWAVTGTTYGRLSELLRYGLNTSGALFANSAVTLWVVPEGGDTTDGAVLFSGQVEAVTDATQSTMTLRCTERLARVREDEVTSPVCPPFTPFQGFIGYRTYYEESGGIENQERLENIMLTSAMGDVAAGKPVLRGGQLRENNDGSGITKSWTYNDFIWIPPGGGTLLTVTYYADIVGGGNQRVSRRWDYADTQVLDTVLAGYPSLTSSFSPMATVTGTYQWTQPIDPARGLVVMCDGFSQTPFNDSWHAIMSVVSAVVS